MLGQDFTGFPLKTYSSRSKVQVTVTGQPKASPKLTLKLNPTCNHHPKGKANPNVRVKVRISFRVRLGLALG